MRDAMAEFEAVPAIPVGVNGGDAASHLGFIEAFDFPFDLLVDDGLAVARAYGALKPDSSGIQRTVVAIGQDGRIVFRQEGAPPPAEIIASLESAAEPAG